MPTAPVVLQNAYAWTCPSCGRHQYGEPKPLPPASEPNEYGWCARKAAVRRLAADWANDVAAPDRVTCDGCGEVFDVFIETE